MQRQITTSFACFLYLQFSFKLSFKKNKLYNSKLWCGDMDKET